MEAAGIADALVNSGLVTRSDLQVAIVELRADIIKWTVGLALAQVGLLVGILVKLL